MAAIEGQDTEQEYYLRLAPLIQGVFQNATMEEIMERVENILGRPVMVIDMGFKVINESPSINASYKLYVRNDVFLVEECIFKLKASHIYWNLAKRDFSSTLIRCPEYENFLVASIKTNATDVMMLIVFENTLPFQQKDYALIKRICEILSVQYQKEGIAYYSHMVFPNHIVFALLNGEDVSREEFRNRVEPFPWTQYSKHYIMVLDTAKTGMDFRPRHASILKSLLAFIGENHCLTYENLIVGFLGPEQFQNVYHESREKFEAFLAANSLICAISQTYADIMDSRKYYMSALLLSCCMRKYGLRMAYFFDSHAYLLHELITRNYEASLFYHPAVVQLIDYDREHSSGLLETLDAYQIHKSDPDQAAEQLFIHRSTLFYRLKKIRELTGLDTDNPGEMARIFLSLQLHKIDKGIYPSHAVSVPPEPSLG